MSSKTIVEIICRRVCFDSGVKEKRGIDGDSGDTDENDGLA